MELRPVVKAMLELQLPTVHACWRATIAYIQAPGYTQFNTAGLILWYAFGCPPTLGAVLWCNSCGVVFSYEMTRLVGKESIYCVKRQIPPYSDVILHIAPFILLRHVPSGQLIHALISATAHFLWAAAHDFDPNIVYALEPKLSTASMCFLWLCALIGHIAAAVCRFEGPNDSFSK